MDKKQRISVRINGELTNQKEEEESVEDFPTFEYASTYYIDEQAAAVEKEDEEPENDEQKSSKDDTDYDFDMSVLERSYTPKKKKSFAFPALKRFILTVVSAAVIGLGLGFVMLRLFAGIDGQYASEEAFKVIPSQQEDESPSVPTTSSNKTDNQNDQPVPPSNNTESAAVMLDGQSSFVIQAGVFSTYDKAVEWQTELNASGITTFIWERDGQHYLFSGIGSTKEKTKEMAAIIEGKGYDMFVKPWTTPTLEVKSEEQWLQSGLGNFANAIKESMGLMLIDVETTTALQQLVQNFKQSKPETLTEQSQSLDRAVMTLEKKVEQYNQNPSTQDLWGIQMALLNIWKQVENFRVQ